MERIVKNYTISQEITITSAETGRIFYITHLNLRERGYLTFVQKN